MADDLLLPAPVTGQVIRVEATIGQRVEEGAELVVVESMKSEFALVAERAGTVVTLSVTVGDGVTVGEPVGTLRPGAVASISRTVETVDDPDHVRPDLAEAHARHAATRDDARPDAVARRRARGQRTARENLAALCDPDTFVEYGPLALAAQRSRRPLEELIARSPADGLVCGVARINGDTVGPDRADAVVLAYDATVFAGTQGATNHHKKDRMLDVACRRRLPVVLFAEGGGGRPGDVDVQGSGLDVPAFALFARLSGLVPLVGVVSGRCFAGNAALLGCCDVIIATVGTTLGMGGPAMIEGGGLGTYEPDEVGPLDVQVPNGVVDVVVEDETEAAAVARRYLAFFQGPRATWHAPDQRALRRAVPERRVRAYDVRTVIEGLADEDGWLELRPGFGTAMVTGLVRIEGRPYGLIANDPRRLGGAIDSDAADTAARFLQLCDAHGLPVVSLCDTPGYMVGPEAERT
ncbi:MAG: carboxyl transferase domain-containing protein, partial [Solirubrobacteraceae bacterium]